MLSKLNCFVLTFQEDVEVKESTTSQEDEESEDEGLEEVQEVWALWHNLLKLQKFTITIFFIMGELEKPTYT